MMPTIMKVRPALVKSPGEESKRPLSALVNCQGALIFVALVSLVHLVASELAPALVFISWAMPWPGNIFGKFLRCQSP